MQDCGSNELGLTQNALHVLEKRYFAKREDATPAEDAQGMFRRVARAVAAAERRFDPAGDDRRTEKRFYDMMSRLEFLPNSPTLMNAGRPLGQLSACFVLPVGDSMEEIFEAVKQAALIHKSGGGTGFSFSRLRPRGAAVRSTGGAASGPVSFMRVFNAATEAVRQGGTRRGANMGVLRVDHPDILEFIGCKNDSADFTNFNISVGVTEAFMERAQRGESYDLVDPRSGKAAGRLNAGAVFGRIVDSAWRNGEPGVIFLDRINRDNVTPGQGEIESTNPCGEQPLLPYESCNLGSINLARMLRETPDGWEVDFQRLAETVTDAVRFLDNVIEINLYPLSRIEQAAKATRKIGLGVMGFADMLLKLSLPYNAEEAAALAEKIMALITKTGRDASAALARRRGSFPLLAESVYSALPALRNGTVTTIAPTGTLSIIAGCSSGVEPVFAYAFTRRFLDGTEMAEVNPILREALEKRGLYSDGLVKRLAGEGSLARVPGIPEDLRRVFVCAHDIAPIDHVRVQAAFQKHTDNAVSKTVNFPHSASREDVAEVYRLAYRLGCKGITLYRDGSRANQTLSIGSARAGADTGPPARERCPECGEALEHEGGCASCADE